jgi:hypothetical protein
LPSIIIITGVHPISHPAEEEEEEEGVVSRHRK